LAFLRLEQLLKNVMVVVENDCDSMRSGMGLFNTNCIEESAALRKVSAIINSDMTKLAELMLLLAGEEGTDGNGKGEHYLKHDKPSISQFYVRVILLGKKPERFMESTTIPTFLEWENPSICRVPQKAVLRAQSKEFLKKFEGMEARICTAFAEPLVEALSTEIPKDSIVLRLNMPSDAILNKEVTRKTFLIVTLVHMSFPGYANSQLLRDSSIAEILSAGGSKRFLFCSRENTSTLPMKSILSKNMHSGISHTKQTLSSSASGLMELTVAHRFPCALSRQRTIITSEFFS